MISYILGLVCGLAIIGVDQYTKHLVTTNMSLTETKGFLKGFIDLTYIHNTGSAWGMLSGYTWVLLALTIIVMLICITLLFKTGLKNKLMFWAMILVISGGIGNMIDRIFRKGNVVDFLQFAFFKKFPIFNVADIAVVCGAALLILYFVTDTIKDIKKSRKSADKGKNDENK
ncbi:MAG: signal peptidase II [Acutalibacteraceae bacterium]